MTTYAVTGASGFLGSHIVDALPPEDTVAIARRPFDTPAHTTRFADLRDVDALTAAFADCEVVIANAALAPGRSQVTEAALMEANLAGTRNTLDAAVAAGVRRVVLISTIAVYKPRFRQTLTESSALRDPDNRSWDFSALTTNPAYARSKSAAEALAWTYSDRLELTAVRPGPIYGPRDHKLTLRYARWARSASPVMPGLTLPHAFGPDVADLARRCAQSAEPGSRFNCGGHALSPAQFVSAFRGRSVLRLRLPTPIRVDDSLARSTLGWTPTPVADALDACRRWVDGLDLTDLG